MAWDHPRCVSNTMGKAENTKYNVPYTIRDFSRLVQSGNSITY